MKNDNRPIGVFDSGLGGLTAVRKLMEVLPGEDIIYLGDTGRVPYGSRSRETIIRYARQDIAFLQKFDIKAVVVACGTVSTTALDSITDDYDVPVFGVVEATAQSAAHRTRNGRIGLIGTEASIGSGAYEREICRFAPQAQVFGKACPLFVPLVECGRITPGDIVIETVAAEYLAPLKAEGVDTLILGCTHYPLLTDIIANFMGPEVEIISSGAETAEYVAQVLKSREMLADRPTGVYSYYVTDSVKDFSRMASLFLETDVRGDVAQISLDGN
jgi:glutamate racemase